MTSRHDYYPRDDRARRRRLRAAAARVEGDWRAADALPEGLAATIEALHDAPPEFTAAQLLPWLRDTAWLRERLSDAMQLLAADPFARPPLRPVGGGEGAAGLILAEQGSIRLSLQIHRFEQAAGAPSTAIFIPGVAAIRVLESGGAMLHRHHVALSEAEAGGIFSAAVAGPCQSAPPRPLLAGQILRLDTARDAFSLAAPTGDVLLLELAVQPPSPLPIRSYDIASGRLVHVSASRRDSSFRTMAFALLRSFARTDAAPLFAEATQAEDFAARWSALREFVALDPAAARPRVEAMAASDPHPEIRRAAAATLALYPDRQAEPCHA